MAPSLRLTDVIAAIKSKSVSQAKLAELAGISQPAVSQIASGATKSPAYETVTNLIAAAKKLGVKPPDSRKTDKKQTKNRKSASSAKAESA